MRAIYGLYPNPHAAQHAVEELRRAGVRERAITVVSSQPFEEFEFSHRDKPTWIYWIAAAGGAVGLLVGFLIAYGTQTAWPIVTGGMPIVPMYPNIIIMFELTMLGAILSTVVALFITTELPAVKSTVYDSAVSDGKILVGVENPSDDAIPTLRQTLQASGTSEVRVL
jgi:hypothetical protein